jgi:hypothetical protein
MGEEGRMTIIYVVTEGRYSSYHIEAVFSTKEVAEQYVQKRRGPNLNLAYDEYEIEEYTLDLAGTDWLEGRVKCWLVEFKAGSADIECIKGMDNTVSEMDESMNWRGEYSIFLMADTQEHAAKIAVEKRSIYLANNPVQ